MTIKTVYQFKAEDLILKNDKDKGIVIHSGDILEFEPEYYQGSKFHLHKITLSHENDKAVVFKAGIDLVEKIVEKSVQKNITENIEVFTIAPNAEKFQSLVARVSLHLDSFIDSVKNVDISANSLEVTKHAQVLATHMKSLEEVDFSNLDPNQKNAIKYFDKEPVELTLGKENVKLNSDPYKYIKPLEDFAKSTLENAQDWLKDDKDPDMAAGTTQDFIDILKISSLINKGRLKEAYDATSLDTYVREGLPDDFWSEWVLPVGEDKSILTAQEAELNKPTKKAKPK
jgi:hypothetical protein